MSSLGERGAVVLRTDREGTIVVRTDGQRIRIESNGDAWALSPSFSAP
jgi:beta-lactamase superfamily II metal-dependent hydrolase